jgi:hypothetical protein
MAIPAYAFYKDTYHGVSIPDGEWDRLATRADEQIMQYERAYTVTDPTGDGRDKAVCAIADQMYTYEVVANSELSVDADGNIGATSVSIGSVSVSRKSPSAANMGLDMTEAGQQRQFYKLAQLYLDMYRGVRHAGCY